MDVEHWRRIEELLCAALECDGGERAAFIERARGGDAGLRREVESLLAHEAPSESFIEDSAFALAAEILADDAEAERERWEGRQVGAYRIVREIGRGGMGAVFLAERVGDEFRQQVALKVVRRSLARPNTLSYRAAKFVRRNRITVTAAAIVLLTLVAGLSLTLHQYQNARRERIKEEAVNGYLRQMLLSTNPAAKGAGERDGNLALWRRQPRDVGDATRARSAPRHQGGLRQGRTELQTNAAGTARGNLAGHGQADAAPKRAQRFRRPARSER